MKRYLIAVLLIFVLFDTYIATKIFQSKKSIPPAVPTAAQEAQRIADECADTHKVWQSCTYTQFDTLTKKYPFAFVLETLHALEKIDGRAKDCHLSAHAIAIEEIAKNPNAWEDFLSKVDANYCTGGFIHGVVESLSRHDPKFTLNELTLPQICDIVKKSVHGGGGDQYCAHISGHILLVVNSAHIPDAVKVCDKVPQNIQYQCYGGIFMESITRDNLAIHGLAKKRSTTVAGMKEQENLCRQYQGLAATGCWREISHMYVVVDSNDPVKLYASCSKAPTPHDRDECFLHAVGLVVREPNLNRNAIASLCNPLSGDNAGFKRCVNETIGTLLSASKNYAEIARTFCKGIPTTYQKDCFATIEKRLGSSPRED